MLELYLNSNKLKKLPAFSIPIDKNELNYIILYCIENEIEQIDEFAASLKNCNKLKKLEIYLSKNKLTKLPAFSSYGANTAVLN